MLRQVLSRRPAIAIILLLQIVPLLLFPPESYSPTTQEWWLPVLLTVLVLVADSELILRRRGAAWPWYLIGFAQGFNIISRLMMVWSHAVVTVEKAPVVNGPYLVLTLLSVVFSMFMLWYMELPEVRMNVVKAA